jgi:hypothetical protein
MGGYHQKLVVKNRIGGYELDLSDPGWGQMASLYEQGNKPSGSVNCCEYLYYLSSC